MSRGAPVPLRPNRGWSARDIWPIAVWAIIVIAVVVYLKGGFPQSARFAAQSEDLSRSVEELRRTIDEGPQTLKTEVTRIQSDAQGLQQKLTDVEDVLARYRGQFQLLEERSSTAESLRAVQRAQVVEVAAQVQGVRQRLRTLETLEAAWQARQAALLTGDAGRRIAASPAHLELVEGVLREDRPTAEQRQLWNQRIEALAPLIEAAARDQKTEIVITPEHVAQINDLGQTLVAAVALAERQQQLLDACLRETATQAPHVQPLQALLAERRQTADRAQRERIDAARRAARVDADQTEVTRLEQLERQLGAERLQAREQARRQDEERLRQRDQEEEDRKAQEARLVQAANKARNLGLKAEADRADEALRLAQLQRDFERLLPEARTLLQAFVTPGFRHRPNGTKGPVSLAFLKSNGALEPTQTGLEQLLRLASYNNDRELGGLPHYVTGALTVGQEARRKPVERAQELLNKYGEVLVLKGMLDP